MFKFPWLFLIIALSTLLASAVPASAAFQCPAADPPAQNRPSVDIDAALAYNSTSSRTIVNAIARLREHGLKGSEIVDQLVTAYCGRIASRAGLSDKSKAEQVRQFASNLVSHVYSSPKNTPEDIIISVPVPTRLYNRLRQAAKTARVSESAWTIGAIRNRLAAP